MTTDVVEKPPVHPLPHGKASAAISSPAKTSPAKTWLKAIDLTSRIEADPSRLFADVVEDWAGRQPDRPALISDTETFTYRTLASRINQYARWALSAGIEPGDTVCLLMRSRPDYVAAWLGISQGRRRGGAGQHQAGRVVAGPLHQRRQAPATSSSPRISRMSSRWRGRTSKVRRDSGSMATAPRARCGARSDGRRARCRRRNGATSPSTIGRC